MKRILALMIGALLLATAASAQAPAATPAPDKTAASGARVGPSFVDDDGDGICDHRAAGAGRRGKGYGPGDGSGNQGVGPRDGSGYGPGAGSGNCDGTGPKGQRRGPRR